MKANIMIIKNLEVTSIVLTKLDTKNELMDLKIGFSNDTPLKMTMKIEEEFDILISKLLKKIKEQKLPGETDEDEILGGITVLTIKNEEDIKEKSPKRLFMLTQRLDSLKKTRDATNYMKLFSQISTMEETIYSYNPGTTF